MPRRRPKPAAAVDPAHQHDAQRKRRERVQAAELAHVLREQVLVPVTRRAAGWSASLKRRKREEDLG